MADAYDDLETRSPATREAAQLAELPYLVAHAQAKAPYFRELLGGIEPAAITTREALARLPVTRKSALTELQRQRPPFGGLATETPGQLVRIFQSPGPIYDLQGHERDYWRVGRALFAAGIRAGDIIHNTFSYHFTPAAAMIEGGARAIGCAIIPAGTGNTEQQLRAIADIRPQAYAGTPSFLKALLERGREAGMDLSSLKHASVTAEALPPSLREQLKGYGVSVRQWYGTADVGVIAYESEPAEGLIVDEGLIVEIVRPGTGDPVAEGEVGEVVVTLLSSREYPLIRFATGDLSAVLPGQSPCGRTSTRLKGWMGRADQTTKVKGMFVHPSHVAEVLRRHPEIAKARLVVVSENGQDVMTLHCETHASDAPAVADSLQAICKLKGRIELTALGTLPNDGKVIDDCRNYK